MMKAKEKAISFYERIFEEVDYSAIPSDVKAKDITKTICLLAIDEIISEASATTTTVRYKGCVLTDKEYWEQVKSEFENI